MRIYFQDGRALFKDGGLRQCCCAAGLFVESVDFELLDPLYDPFCLRVAQGSGISGCADYDITVQGATLLAADHLASLDYIASGDSLPGRPCGFCEGSKYLYYLVDAEEVTNGFIIKFEVEDCSNNGPEGIPPRDYLCTVTISKCSK